MNLLFYLLLVPSSVNDKSSPKSRSPLIRAQSEARAVLVPGTAVLAKGRVLQQASRSRVAHLANRQKYYTGRLGAVLGVVFNAMGFLLLTSGLLFLLQLAQISLY